jgi:hypothetical protein
MAYTICDQYGAPKPLRLVMAHQDGSTYIGKEFEPVWWVCDPCNPSSRRFEITFRSDGQAQGFPWYQVITSDDSSADEVLKVSHYARVIEAKRVADAAMAEYKRLNGGY